MDETTIVVQALSLIEVRSNPHSAKHTLRAYRAVGSIFYLSFQSSAFGQAPVLRQVRLQSTNAPLANSQNAPTCEVHSSLVHSMVQHCPLPKTWTLCKGFPLKALDI